jgi:Kdo2-lipid IVA lauroyltransferase/acyltransferase
MGTSRWKRAKRSARAAVVRGTVRVMSALPLPAGLALGGLVGRLAWLLGPGQRRDMRASLAAAFPEMSAAERDAVGRACLAHLGWLGAEMVALAGRPGRVERYVEVPEEAQAAIGAARRRGKGIVLVLGHIGNWELTSRLSPLLAPFGVIAKRSWHRSIDGLAERARAAGGITTLWRGDTSTGRSMLRLLKAGGTLGMLIDQDIASVQSVHVPFFGRPAATPRGAADLALRFGAAVLVVTCHRRGRRPGDGHVLEVTEVPYDPAPPDTEAEVVRLTAACVRLQEEAIRRHPAEWVWMHRRWKSRPPEPLAEAPLPAMEEVV